MTTPSGATEPPRCVDCSAPATIQVISAEGVLVAAYCDEDWAATQKFGDAIMAMLEDACKQLTGQAEAEFAGDLSAFKPSGLGHAMPEDTGCP